MRATCPANIAESASREFWYLPLEDYHLERERIRTIGSNPKVQIRAWKLRHTGREFFFAGGFGSPRARIVAFRCHSLSFGLRTLQYRRTDAKDTNMKMSVIQAVRFV